MVGSTRVVLSLPIRRRVSSGKPLRVLIIDDDDSVRELLVDFMWSLGHEPTIAVDGREGVTRFEREAPTRSSPISSCRGSTAGTS
jgi:PleD family two-component response regulator